MFLNFEIIVFTISEKILKRRNEMFCVSKDVCKIALRRKDSLIIESQNPNYKQKPNEKALIVAALKNVQSLGFTFSKELFETLTHFTYAEIQEFYKFLIPALKELRGADVEYAPMYPNFPRQVMEASSAELFINAIIHYWTFGEIMPEYSKDERLPLIDDNKMTVLSISKPSIIGSLLNDLAASKTSISQQDKEDIATIVKQFKDYRKYLPSEIFLKENVAYISKLILENAPIKNSAQIERYFKTATDVLRLITAFSDGDISLAQNTKYKSLKRYQRRIVMDLLSNCGNITEDLFRYQYEWVRAAEIFHPFEFIEKRYQNVNKAFDTLRNEKKPLFFAGKVQKLIEKYETIEAADLLRVRPGEFARKLDKLLRDSDKPLYVVHRFSEVADKVTTPVLLQARQHFINRVSQDDVRVIFPKGNLAKAVVLNKIVPRISSVVCENITSICEDALDKQYKSREKLGKVYIDEEFSNYFVPFSQRSASKAIKSIVRGSRVPIKENAKAVRGFIWWTNIDSTYNGRVDLDLSGAIYDENWNYITHISYTQLRSQRFKACHSGDITDGRDANGKGVAEFIDFDIDEVNENAGRYVVFQVYSYTQQHFSNIPHARFGWMEREDVNSGEIFEPSAVEMKLDLTSDSAVSIPVIFDCKERKFIWCDMNLQIAATRYGGNNLENNLRGVTATCYGLANMQKPNLYDLVYFNALARGEIVNDRNEADIIFSNDKTVPYEVVTEIDEETGNERRVLKEKTEVPIITAFDTDYFMGQLI